MFITDNSSHPAFVDSNRSLVVKEIIWGIENSSDDLYQQLVFKVLKKPKLLISHLQRIYLTYSLGMQDQLYAALVDLLWVLDGKGIELSSRMVKATQTHLTDQQAKLLGAFLNNTGLLVGNKFSVCITEKGKDLIVEKNIKLDDSYDPLDLARDYIEYSQLDEALKTLEEALILTPERQDIQSELLELLKVTKNIQEFTRIKQVFLDKEMELSGEWSQLAEYFSGISDEK